MRIIVNDDVRPMPEPTPNGGASQPIGEVRAYRPGEMKSKGGSLGSKLVVTIVVAVVATLILGAVVGAFVVFRSAKDKVDEVKTAVESALVHPDCDLLVDGMPVPSEFVVADSIDLSCGGGVNVRLGVITTCLSSGRQYATNSLGHAFLDDRVYRAGLPGPC